MVMVVDEDITHDIITEDSVSHCSKISDENHNSPVSHGTHENVSHDDTHEYHTSPDPHDVSSMSDSSCQVVSLIREFTHAWEAWGWRRTVPTSSFIADYHSLVVS